MDKIREVTCVYTGGGIWVYHAKYGKLWLYGSLDSGIDAYDADPDTSFPAWREHIINGAPYEYYDGYEYDGMNSWEDSDSHIVKTELPKWSDIVESLRYPDSVVDDVDGAEASALYWNAHVIDCPCNDNT